MKAQVISKFGGPDVYNLQDVPDPVPRSDEVLIKVRAFGINHAEMHMRKGEWAEWMPISGIECVGTVAACPGGEFDVGNRVATLMGGLGRTIDGSYAEYTITKVSNVVGLGAEGVGLGWAQLAAIPESYATAWACLFRNLELEAGQRLLIRGGTSAFGRAAINLAVEAGAHVTATTRDESGGGKENLESIGVEQVETERPDLSENVSEKFDAVLDFVGNDVLIDSLKLARRGGRVCLAEFLGGLDPVSNFDHLSQMGSGVHFSFFGSFVFGQPEFPLTDVPIRDIVTMVADKKFDVEPSRVFGFDQIREAHRVMEANETDGKLVVVLP